ncbi:MAG: hypothetical protein F2667_03340 [Actinobacteria bacterium]|uniref:Unannotated protein n=1 Tax=freshwater metagenome TaxID=449393 RepID=A0A6J6PEU3_9ZZZZ|nr:hypothetical protein [Actinomycetota bacterium]
MDRRATDPNQLPPDAEGRDLATYVGEDIGRQFMLRLSVFVALLCLLGGATTDAEPAVKAAGASAGGLGAFLLLIAGLSRWQRPRQWTLLLLVLGVCGALLAVMLVQHRAAS